MNDVRAIQVRMTVTNSQYVAGMRQAAAVTGQTGAAMEKTGRLSAQHVENIGRYGRNTAVVLGGALTLLERANIRFDKEMSAAGAATNASTKQLGLLRTAAINAGRDTSFSATEAAQGITELAKAGVTTQQILGGGLSGALDLAAAGQIGVAEAAETAASAMAQFGLKGRDVTHIADLLSSGADAAQGGVHDLGAALNQSGLVASQVGLSIEETVGALTAFAHAGLIGSDAGTSLKTMLLSLNPRSKEAATLMDRLNLSAYDAQGNFIGLERWAGKLRAGLSDLSAKQRAAALQTIFGTDAVRAANIIYREGADGVAKYITKVNDQGHAQKRAADLTDNLAGDIERLGGSLEATFIKSGGPAQNELRHLVQMADDLVNTFADLPAGVQQTTVKAVALAAVLSGAVYGASKLVTAFNTIRGIGRGSAALGAAGALRPVPVYIVNGPGGVGGPGVVGGPAGGKGGKGLTGPGGPAGIGLWGGIAASSMVAMGGGMRELDTAERGFINTNNMTVTQLKRLRVELQEAGQDTSEITQEINRATTAQHAGSAAWNTAYTLLGRLSPELGRYGTSLKELPRGVVTKIMTPGAVKSAADVKQLARQYHLTPKQVRTIARILGIPGVVADARRGARAADDLGRKRPKPVADLIDRVTGATRKPKSALSLLDRVDAKPSVHLQDNATDRINAIRANLGRLNGAAAYTTAVTIMKTVHPKSAQGNIFGPMNYALGGFTPLAYGDVANRHQAELAGPGGVRVWREPETQGEAYIPLANDDRRTRAKAILAQTATYFGGQVQWMARGGITAGAAAGGVSAASLRNVRLSGVLRIPGIGEAILDGARLVVGEALEDYQDNRDREYMAGGDPI